jgi:polysaccharide deacetylase family protein (PEP-CTERM system associated)
LKNALTIDVEDWYQTLDFNFDIKTWNTYEDRIEYSLNLIIDMLDKYNVKGTFFVLGCLAEKHPKLIRRLAEKGHEIGSHGSFHKLVYSQTKEEFREDIMKSKKLLEDITAKEVVLFRASSWSISENTLWALSILEEEGYMCDSSIQPFKTPLSGINGAPRVPYYPIVNGEKLKLLEFPPTVMSINKLAIPFCGGLYLRALPMPFINYAINKVNKSSSALIYAHPWEVDLGQPRLDVPPHIQFTHYYNLNNTLNKLNKLLHKFEFVPLGEVIKGVQYDALPVTIRD